MRNYASDQELWFQQDGATYHTARATIDLLKDTFGDRLISRFGPVNWPPRSWDLTPLDYFLWGYVKWTVFSIDFFAKAVSTSATFVFTVNALPDHFLFAIDPVLRNSCTKSVIVDSFGAVLPGNHTAMRFYSEIKFHDSYSLRLGKHHAPPVGLR
ncbi:DNA-directed RNA polymerase subunit [Trichonephila clavipes]|nr:DNA-directed RNA polymerase subunit [Trichonephila clavipes]